MTATPFSPETTIPVAVVADAARPRAASAAQTPAPEAVKVAGVRIINCNDCHENKAETEFPFKNKATGRRSTKCKPCMRAYAKAHYQANKATRVPQVNKRSAQVRAQVRAEVAALLADVTCSGCGRRASAGNDLVVVLPGEGETTGLSLSSVIQNGWSPARVVDLVTAAVDGESVLCRRCVGMRCGVQNRQSIAARARIEAALPR